MIGNFHAFINHSYRSRYFVGNKIDLGAMDRTDTFVTLSAKPAARSKMFSTLSHVAP